jgi:colanic acid biosynthesis glycosyl transferase WcaI
MVNKIKEKAKKPVFLFPNWTDVGLFFPIEDRSAIKKEYGYNSSDKIILYSGSIGEKQGLEAILHAANELRHIGNLKFIICGSGPYKQALQTMAENLTLDNLQFLPLQPFEKFNKFLNLADLHLIIQKASASDLVMPSKLTTILSAGGLTLITANKGSGLHSLISDYNIGLFVDAENQQALNEGIVKAIGKDLSHVSRNARKYAENFLSIDKIMPNFEQILFSGQPIKFEAIEARTPGVEKEAAVGEEIPRRLDGDRTEG